LMLDALHVTEHIVHEGGTAKAREQTATKHKTSKTSCFICSSDVDLTLCLECYSLIPVSPQAARRD
jgi:hypothetical protein